MWTLKIDRAKEHLKELRGEITSFFKTNPYVVGTKTDSSSKRLVYYLTKADEVPSTIPLITGEVIQNLRSSLDHLAYDLFAQNSPTGVISHHIYFPIAKNAATYQKEKPRKTAGISAKNLAFIDQVKPYQGGNDELWRIHELNNIDKHRLLVTVGSSFSSVDIGARMVQNMRKLTHDNNIPKIPLFLVPVDPLFPLQVDAELFTDDPGAEVVPDMEFRFDILLNEPGIVDGKPVVESLEAMISAVDNLIPIFK